MKMFNIQGELESVDVRPSSYPIKGISKSKLQKIVGDLLQERFPRDPVLEEFTIPGSRLRVDFFLPRQSLVIEIDGRQHQQYVPHFHQARETMKFAKQISNDRKKDEWCEVNGFRIVRILEEKDMELI